MARTTPSTKKATTARKPAAKKATPAKKATTTAKVTTPKAGTKDCPRCKALGRKVHTHATSPNKGEGEFYKDKSTKDGFAVWCKRCEREYNVAYNARRALKDAESAVTEFKAANGRKKVPAELTKAVTDAKAKVEATNNHDPVGRGAKTPTHVPAMTKAA